MKKDVLNKKITIDDFDSKIVGILLKENINTIYDLWNLTRKDLKKMGLTDSDINLVIIKLQLMGLDLNKKIY